MMCFTGEPLSAASSRFDNRSPGLFPAGLAE